MPLAFQSSTEAAKGRKFGVAVIASIALAMGLVVDMRVSSGTARIIMSQAEAVVGRPATATSARGVARRTTRRTVTRTNAYVASLPANCAPESVNGETLYLCGSTYYMATDGQYVVVTVD
jgi:hypothetical protein